MTTIPGFDEFQLTNEQGSRRVFFKGSGPGVVIMHELAGLTRECVDFAERVSRHGFSVFVPLLFGEANQKPKAVRMLVHVCLSREFHCFAKRKSSPITNWLRTLCREVHQRCGGPGVGAIGMCLTGNFVLAMMVDPSVMAPVLSQPSLPFPITSGHKAALATSLGDPDQVKQRAVLGLPLLGLRFTNDRLCPKERFQALQREFGDRFEAHEIVSPDVRHGIKRGAHAVLTFEYRNAIGHPTHDAFERVIAFLDEQLVHPLSTSPSGGQP